jgi:hypothetical protein
MTATPKLPPPPSERSLWFGFVTAAAAWTLLGFLDVVLVWRFCVHPAGYAMPPVPLAVRWIYFLPAAGLLALTVYAGLVSHRNWRRLSTARDVVSAQAVERREFMAALGVIVTITMGMGIVWLALPPFLIDLCQRAR